MITQKRPFLLQIAIFLILVTTAFNTHAQVKDYLSVPGPIQFDSVKYFLSWSSHPSENYYKHEYLPKGDDPDKYKEMVMIEFVVTDLSAKDAMNAKIAELAEAKKTNPVVNYMPLENESTGDCILDFLVSANSADGKTVTIVERNVYHYKKIKTPSGQNGILFFGVSVRSYGNDITDFLRGLKNNRDLLLNGVIHFTLPDIKIAP